jgi:imidazolonepropionase
VRTTFLGAHALPPEYRDRRTAYVDLICDEMLPALAAEGLVDAVDGFCETIAFSREEIARVFDAARRLNLPVKLHAEQLSNQSGAALAASYGALSADHLEHLDEKGAAAMAQAGTVAVLLPGAFYTLRETKAPPVAALRQHGAQIAVATDSNPGTSPLTSLLTALNMAATLFRLTVDECLLGVTKHAARALGLQAELGSLEAGKAATFALWDIERPAELVYRIGFNPLHRLIRSGA